MTSKRKHLSSQLCIHVSPDRDCTVEKPLYAVRALKGTTEIMQPLRGYTSFVGALKAAAYILELYNRTNGTRIPDSCIKAGDSYSSAPHLCDLIEVDKSISQLFKSGIIRKQNHETAYPYIPKMPAKYKKQN